MRKFKNVSEKCMIAILAAAMMMSTVTTSIAMPVTVYAAAGEDNSADIVNNTEDWRTNTGHITNNGDSNTSQPAIHANVHPGVIDNNYGTVTENTGSIGDNNGTVTGNTGSIGDNNGTVTGNAGSIGDNNGRISVNHDLGSVTSNSGTINSNNGAVTTNNGLVGTNSGSITTNNSTVTHNGIGGSIEYNYGTVGLNYMSDGSSEAGSVVHNYSTVTTNYGLVTNNYGGAVTTNYGVVSNNYGGTVTNDSRNDFTGIIENQYYKVSTELTNAGAAYTSGFVTPADGNKYILASQYDSTEGSPTQGQMVATNNSGTITITPVANYEITGDNATDQQGIGFTYSVTRQENGSYQVVLSALTSNITITPAMLNLVISAIQANPAGGEGNGNNSGETPQIIVKVDDSIKVVEERRAESNNNVTETAAATGNVLTAAQIDAMIESALAANPGATVLDIYLGNDPSITAETLVALCEKNNVAKRCHFTHNGQKFFLFIPVIDPTSAAYQQCKALLDAEKGKQAGPIRLSQIFAPVGFSNKEE